MRKILCTTGCIPNCMGCLTVGGEDNLLVASVFFAQISEFFKLNYFRISYFLQRINSL